MNETATVASSGSRNPVANCAREFRPENPSARRTKRKERPLRRQGCQTLDCRGLDWSGVAGYVIGEVDDKASARVDGVTKRATRFGKPPTLDLLSPFEP